MSTNSYYKNWYLNTFNYTLPRPADENASGRYRLWQIAVNIPIPNFHFTYPQKVIRQLIADSSAGADGVYVGFTDTTARDTFVNLINVKGYGLVTNTSTKIGEIVQLSGSYSFPGALSGQNGVKVDFYEALNNSYTGGQGSFEFFTDKIAEKWKSTHPKLYPKGLKKKIPIEMYDMDGKFFAQQLAIDSSNFNALPKSFSCELPNLHQFANNYDLQTGVIPIYYRLGLRYYIKYSGNPADASDATVGTIYARLNGTDNPNKIKLNYVGGTTNKYFVHNSYPAFNDWKSFTNIRDSSTYKELEIRFTGVNSPIRSLEFGLDDVYLEHSGGVEDSTDLGGSCLGCLLLTNAPNRDSISMSEIKYEEEMVLSNGDKYSYFPMGSPNSNRKYRIACTFENSTMDTWRKLKIIETWQDAGYNINLHTHMPELPEVLTGRMKIGESRKDIFDFRRVSFSFEFEEV